jgi:hypothetical protein
MKQYKIIITYRDDVLSIEAKTKDEAINKASELIEENRFKSPAEVLDMEVLE